MTAEEAVAKLTDDELVREVKRLRAQISNLTIQKQTAALQVEAIDQQITEKVQIIAAIRYRIERL